MMIKKYTEEMDYDLILEHLGELGKWNLINQALLWIPIMIAGMLVLQFSIVGLQPEQFRCEIPKCDVTFDPSFDDVPCSIFPYDEDGDRDFCKYFPPYQNISQDVCHLSSSFDMEAMPEECKAGQDSFIYDNFEMDTTVVTEWDLVCDDEFMVALIDSIYMVGMLLGSFAFGWLGDHLGRRWTLALAIVTATISGTGGALVNHVSWYCVTRFFAGTAHVGMAVVGFVLIVELAGEKTRTMFGVLEHIPFAIGESIVALVGLRVKDWRDFHYWTSLPFLLGLGIFFVVPESPRWLLKKHKTRKFLGVIEKAAKKNKVKIPSELLDPTMKQQKELKSNNNHASESDRVKTKGVSALFSTRTMTKVTLGLWVSWFVITVGYYGISLGIGDIGPNVFLNFFLISLIEIPGDVFALFTVGHLGRKTLNVLSMLITGVGCLAAAYLEDGSIEKTLLCLFGKFGAAAGFATIYLYTGELYPTEVRSTAVGLCSTIGRIGGILAPQIALYFPTFTFDAFPMLLMGGISVAGGLIALLLPETLGHPMMESIDELDQIEKDGKSFFTWWSTKQVRKQLELNAAKKAS